MSNCNQIDTVNMTVTLLIINIITGMQKSQNSALLILTKITGKDSCFLE